MLCHQYIFPGMCPLILSFMQYVYFIPRMNLKFYLSHLTFGSDISIEVLFPRSRKRYLKSVHL